MKYFIELILIGLLIRNGLADVSHLSKHSHNNGYLPPSHQTATHNLFIEQDNNGINSPSHQSGFDDASRGYLPPYPSQDNHNHDHHHHQHSQPEEHGYLPPPQEQNHIHNQQVDNNLGYLPPQGQSHEQENHDNHHNHHQHQEDRGYLPPHQQHAQHQHEQQPIVDPNLQVSYYNNFAISPQQPNNHANHGHGKPSNSNEEYEDNSNGYNYSPPNHGFEDGHHHDHHQNHHDHHHHHHEQHVQQSDNLIGGPQSSGNVVSSNQNIIQNVHQEYHESNSEESHTKQNQNYVQEYKNEDHQHQQQQQATRDYLPPSSSSNVHTENHISQVEDNSAPSSYQNTEESYEEDERGYLPPIGALELPQSTDTLHIVPPLKLGLPVQKSNKQPTETNHIDLPLPIPQAGYYFIPAVQSKLPNPTEIQTEHHHSANNVQTVEAQQQNQQVQYQQQQPQHQQYQQQQNQPFQQQQQQQQYQQQQIQQQQIQQQEQIQQHEQIQQQQQIQQQEQIQQQQQVQQQKQIQQQGQLSTFEISPPSSEYSRPQSKTEIRIIPSVQTAQEIASQGYLTPSQVIDQHNNFADIDFSLPESNHLEVGQHNFPPIIQTQQQQPDQYVNQQLFEQNQNEVQNTHQHHHHHHEDHSQSNFINFAKHAVHDINNQQTNQINSRPLESSNNNIKQENNGYLPPIKHYQQQQTFQNQQEPEIHNQVTNLQTYMNNVNPNDRYGFLQFQPHQAIENNPSSSVNPPLIFSKPSAIEAYAPGMAYHVSTNVPFSSFTQAGYLPPAGNSKPAEGETQQEYLSSIGFELNEEAKKDLAQQTLSHDNTLFPIGDILGGQDDEVSQIMEQLQGHIRTIQITNHHDHSVKNIKVLDSSDNVGVRTIEILGPGNENPMGEHKVLHVISKVPSPQAVHQTIKIFNDVKEETGKVTTTNNEYLPPSSKKIRRRY